MKLVKPDIKKIDIINASGVRINLIPVFKTINIYQDLFSSVMNGNIYLEDGNKLMQLLPITGEETIEITFRTNESFDYSEYTFACFNTRKSEQNNTAQEIIIEFVSPEYIKTKQFYMAKHLNGEPKDIINKLLSPFTNKKIISDENFSLINYTMPNATVFETINAIMTRIESFSYPDAKNQLFYENQLGFNISTFDYILKKQPKLYSFVKEYDKNKDEDIKINTLLSFNIIEAQDTLKKIDTGYFGDTTRVLNLEDRDFTVMNNVQSKTKNNDDKMEQLGYNSGHNKLQIAPINDTRKNVGKRYTDLSKIINSAKIRSDCPGNSSLNVGDVIQCDIPLSEQNKFDNLMSGNFVISAICNTITRDQFDTCLELLKYGFKDISNE